MANGRGSLGKSLFTNVVLLVPFFPEACRRHGVLNKRGDVHSCKHWMEWLPLFPLRWRIWDVHIFYIYPCISATLLVRWYFWFIPLSQFFHQSINGIMVSLSLDIYPRGRDIVPMYPLEAKYFQRVAIYEDVKLRIEQYSRQFRISLLGCLFVC